MKGKKPRTTRQSRRTRHQRRQGAQVILPHRGPQVQVPQKSQSRKMSMWPARSSSVRNCSRQDVRLHAVQAVDKQDIAELCKDKPPLGWKLWAAMTAGQQLSIAQTDYPSTKRASDSLWSWRWPIFSFPCLRFLGMCHQVWALFFVCPATD